MEETSFTAEGRLEGFLGGTLRARASLSFFLSFLDFGGSSSWFMVVGLGWCCFGGGFVFCLFWGGGWMLFF